MFVCELSDGTYSSLRCGAFHETHYFGGTIPERLRGKTVHLSQKLSIFHLSHVVHLVQVCVCYVAGDRYDAESSL